MDSIELRENAQNAKRAKFTRKVLEDVDKNAMMVKYGITENANAFLEVI